MHITSSTLRYGRAEGTNKTIMDDIITTKTMPDNVPFSNYRFLKELTDRPKLVLDMDDTLYPMSSDLRTSLVAAINYFTHKITGCGLEEANERAANYCRKYGLTIKGLLIEGNIVPEEYEEYLDNYVEYDRIRRDERLISLLEAINADIVIFTNSGWVHTRRILERLDILHLCHLIVFTDYQEASFPVKPDEEAYVRVERLMGNVTPEMIYFVDDNLKNVQAALDRGWNAIQIVEDPPVAKVVSVTLRSTRYIYHIIDEFPILLGV